MSPDRGTSAANWFVSRGYVVVSPLRRGFGKSQGTFVERVSGPAADYPRVGAAAAHDIAAGLAFARGLPDVDASRVVLAGHSAGGFGALALAAQEPGVLGVINFAGGQGPRRFDGRHHRALADAMGAFGARTTAPSLWVYSKNDVHFSPALVTRMFEAYTRGGAPARQVRLPALGRDGHLLFGADARAAWSADVDAFLTTVDP